MSTEHAADRLLAAIDRAGAPACVGLDPVYERLPAALRSCGDAVAGLEAFCLGVLEAVAAHVPCVKLQSACFERYGPEGLAALHRAIAAAKGHGLEVILDFKRGDISLSAEHYAAAAFDAPEVPPDWITVNPYFGADGVEPFLRAGRGVFALLRTSNPGADAVQAPRLADGRSVAESIAAIVAGTGGRCIGESGYSALGAVVAATRPDEAAALRALMPQQVFLVPGYGAQGGGRESIRPCFAADGRGAVVTASRSVIYAFPPDASDWAASVAAAAQVFAAEVAGAGAAAPGEAR